MTQKTKAGNTGNEEFRRKDNSLSFKMQVLTALKCEKSTAKELNQRIGNGFNDSRKCISLLRRAGFDIGDYPLRTDRKTKVYFYTPNIQQGTLFGEEVCCV